MIPRCVVTFQRTSRQEHGASANGIDKLFLHQLLLQTTVLLRVLGEVRFRLFKGFYDWNRIEVPYRFIVWMDAVVVTTENVLFDHLEILSPHELVITVGLLENREQMILESISPQPSHDTALEETNFIENRIDLQVHILKVQYSNCGTNFFENMPIIMLYPYFRKILANHGNVHGGSINADGGDLHTHSFQFSQSLLDAQSFHRR